MSKKNKKMLSLAEFFCGCGGFSRGFSLTKKFRPVLGNDVKSEAIRTYELNHAKLGHVPVTLLKDIRTVPNTQIEKLIRSQGVDELDCLVGGPPCQGFSQMRRTHERRGSNIVRFGGYNKLDQDERNDLVLRFLEIVEALKPKTVVIENVPQFLRHYHDGKEGGVAQQVESILSELGYNVFCDVVNAADYGVPQLRFRAVIIASRLGAISLPKTTHRDPNLPGDEKPWVTVEQAIGDLPAKVALTDDLGGSGLDKYTKTKNAYSRLMRTSKTFPFNHLTRSYDEGIIKIIKEMKAGETWDDASVRMRKRFELLAKVKSGGAHAGYRAEARASVIPAFYKDYYWSAYTRLSWKRPALTITANANFLGSGRFTHPVEDRGITMREAARLQSFDDDFTFYTSTDEHRTEHIGVGMDMIGEAVPPLLAKAFALHIARHIESFEGK